MQFVISPGLCIETEQGGMPRTPDPGQGFESNRVVSLSKAHLLPKSTGNTQEGVAPSQND